MKDKVSHCCDVHLWCELLINCLLHPDINQLKKTMQLTGTPGHELLAKIKSDEVFSTFRPAPHGLTLSADNVECVLAAMTHGPK